MSNQLQTIFQNIRSLDFGLNPIVEVEKIIQETIKKLPENPKPKQVYELAASISANMIYKHPDYSLLGGRILIKYLQISLDVENISFAQNLTRIYSAEINGKKSIRISDWVYNFVIKNADKL